jgi:hypothetical protein
VKIAMVSAHAGYYRDRRCPHVVELSTRWPEPDTMSTSTREGPHRSSPRIHTSRNGYRVVEIPAGPARPIRADDFLPYIGDFGSFLRERGKHDRPDVVHAQFWTSGLAAALATRASRVSRTPSCLWPANKSPRIPKRHGCINWLRGWRCGTESAG